MFADLPGAAEPASEPEIVGTASVHQTSADVSVGDLATSSIRRTAIDGLYLLPCGARIANPADALRAGTIRSLLRELSGQFDLIIIDTPPVLVTADAPLLSRLADGVIMVVRAGRTERAAAERGYQQLTAAGAEVVGAVLNDPSGDLSREWKLYHRYDYSGPGA
jgi:polysaccharide biosynthesis transport protein